MTEVDRRTLLRAAAGLALLTALALALVLAGGASSGAAPQEPDEPGGELLRAGTVRFGETLGGLAIGMSASDVRARWGDGYGVCRSCANETWYFNYEAFRPEGAGVELVDGRVVALFTLWKPAGWSSAGGLMLGTPREEIPSAYLELTQIDCSGYVALVHERADTKTVLYLHDDELWAYALAARDGRVCR